ncbi:MAG: amidohydrolase family protein [Verrucomicrobiota bacterium]
MIVRAKILLPVSRAPIVNGAIRIIGNRISDVGAWSEIKDPHEKVFDLGDSIILPGLINAHCHLDYTHMAGMISPPKFFSDWIKAMLALKAQWSYSEYAASWLAGAQMLLRTGTTTVADIEAVPELLPEVWSATPLRVISLLELTNVKSRRPPVEIIAEAAQKIELLVSERCFAWLSPHALYSTSPELVKRSAELARKNNWLLSTHVAESEEESEMFEHRRGPLFDWLETQRDISDCGDISPVQQLERLGVLSEKFLAVHANYISESDAALLGQRHCSVVHCPRSHEYFGHKKFPYQMLSDAGVNICLGTDSLASVRSARVPRAGSGVAPEPSLHKFPQSGGEPMKSEERSFRRDAKNGTRDACAPPAFELNMFSEMQSFAKANPDVPAETILQMATINGARALEMQKQIGELMPNAFADLIALPFSGKISEAHEAVLQHQGEVSASLVDGNWVESRRDKRQ